MKKFLSMAALALVGNVMTGCSSEDNPADEQQPAKPDNIVTVTTTVGLGDDYATTRALIIDYENRKVAKTFAVGDQVALVYENTNDETVKAVSNALAAEDISADGKTATMTFTLTNPQAGQTVFIIIRQHWSMNPPNYPSPLRIRMALSIMSKALTMPIILT
jgi:hypothetical protein